MPVNKDALKRYRVIDRLLSDPNHDYTTEQILQYVKRETDSNVGIRMIQKDIRALEDEFGKEMALSHISAAAAVPRLMALVTIPTGAAGS